MSENETTVQETDVSEIRSEFGLPESWTDAQVLDWLENVEEGTPVTNEDGVFLYDPTRQSRPQSEWSSEEVKAYLAGELQGVTITPEPTPEEESVVEETVAEDPEPTPEPTPVVEPAPVEPPRSSRPTSALSLLNVSFIKESMERYATVMEPGRAISDQTGGHAQRTLANLFQYVFRLDGKALVEALDMLKAFIHENRKGLFAPEYAYRYIHELKGDAATRRGHVDLIELFLIVTDPNNKIQRKQLDIRAMLGAVPAEKRELVHEYFLTRA